MRFFKAIALVTTLITILSCSKEHFELNAQGQRFVEAYNVNHSVGLKIQKIIDDYTDRGVPGISVAIKNAEGKWEGVSGFAKIETAQAMETGMVHAGGSVTKIYTATAIMKLFELDKIKLDNPITSYLPQKIAGKIRNAEQITVRMLLNHKSGIPDYIENVDFRLHWFNDLSTRWTVDDIFEHLKPNEYNSPGNEFHYSNTNYVLLSLMIENIVKALEGNWMKDNLWNPVGLKHTYYRNGADYLSAFAMPNFYMDRFGDGRLQNVSVPTRVEIYSEYGDGALVATALDFVAFIDELSNGRIISNDAFAKMKVPAQNSEYGLGLDIFKYGDAKQYGHQGAVFGGSSLLLYFEKQKTSLFIAANCDATLVEGKTMALYHEMKNKICDLIATN